MLSSNWLRTRKFNRLLHYMQGRQSLLTFLTVTRWSHSTSNSYVLIGQNLTAEFTRKIMQRLETCLLIAGADRVLSGSFVSSCDVLNCLFLLGVQNEIQLLSRLFYNSWLVCLLRFFSQMHRLSKSLEIRFWMASFSKMSLLTCPCLRRKRAEKSQAILEHLMTFRSSISTGKPEQLLSLLCFFLSVSWSRAYGLCGLSLYTSNDLTYNSIRFKKPLYIFWPRIQRKGSEDYLVIIMAVNRKLWAIFLPRVHLEKEQTPGAGLENK